MGNFAQNQRDAGKMYLTERRIADMKPNARKNQKLIKEFPFLKKIVATKLEPYDGEGKASLQDLTIQVQKADGDLLYRTANNIGLGENSWSSHLKGPRKAQVGRRGEYIFAVDKDGKILKQMGWPRNREEARGKKPRYAYMVLWMTEDGNMLSGSLHDEVEYLVWVLVNAWHKPSGNMDNLFGEFCDRTMHVVVYGKPECGFGKLQSSANVYENLYLSSDVLISAVFDKDTDITSIGGRLDELCTWFQNDVYFNGMQEVFRKGEYRGASGRFGSTEVLVAEMCGYERVMLQNECCWITFQLRPGENSMYVLGEGGTLPQLRALTTSVIQMWKETPECHKNFQSNKNVSVM